MKPEVTNSAAAQVNALLESMMLEDGLGGVGDAVDSGLLGLDPVRARLALIQLVSADVARRVASDDPFEVQAEDKAIRSRRQPDQTESWEQAITDTHALVNQISAVRARCVAEYASRDEGAADELAPVLRLGTYEADRLVEESTWMVERAPRLLDDAVAGSANLATWLRSLESVETLGQRRANGSKTRSAAAACTVPRPGRQRAGRPGLWWSATSLRPRESQRRRPQRSRLGCGWTRTRPLGWRCCPPSCPLRMLKRS